MKITIGTFEEDVDLDLGDDHYLRFITEHADHRIVGAIIFNRTTKTETGWCTGGVWFEAPNTAREYPIWLITAGTLKDGDLTLSPSILCSLCGDHGFIRSGTWVRA